MHSSPKYISAFYKLTMLRNIIFFNSLLFLFTSCKKDRLSKDDELSIQRTPYTGNQLRIDGYYFEKSNNSYFSLYCFYRNGGLLAAGGVFSSTQEMVEYLNKELINSQKYKEYKSNWGVFNIEGNQIKFERWYPSSGGGLPAYVRAGEILNDTTFVIKESYRMQKGKKIEVKERDETYHFKQFSPKPDSTNSFIK
jgi:hypothetical protein